MKIHTRPLPPPSVTNHPKFNSPILQRSVDENIKRFKAFQDSLNKISADVIALEKFLKDCGLNVDFTMVTSARDCGYILALSWERVENNDFRLTVKKYVQNEYDDSLEIYSNESHKPLISQSSEIRRALWSHLPKFVDRLSSEALGPVDALIEPQYNDNIPF